MAQLRRLSCDGLVATATLTVLAILAADNVVTAILAILAADNVVTAILAATTATRLRRRSIGRSRRRRHVALRRDNLRRTHH